MFGVNTAIPVTSLEVALSRYRHQFTMQLLPLMNDNAKICSDEAWMILFGNLLTAWFASEKNIWEKLDHEMLLTALIENGYIKL